MNPIPPSRAIAASLRAPAFVHAIREFGLVLGALYVRVRGRVEKHPRLLVLAHTGRELEHRSRGRLRCR